MTVFYRENGTVPRSLDTIFGVSQCFMLVTSCFLNPIVFTFHFRNRKKTTSLLLCLLALSDFLSLLFGLPFAIVNFFKDERDYVDKPNITSFAITVLQLFFYRLSLFITTMMSIQRLVIITFPRYVIKARMIYAILTIWFLEMVLCFVMYMTDIGIPPIVQNVQKYELDVVNGSFCVWDPMVQCLTCPMGWDDVINNFLINLFGWALINIITSCITIIKLMTRRAKVHGRKSIVTIILLAISASFMYAPAPIGGLFLSNYDHYNAGTSASEFTRAVEYEITFFLIISYLPQITSVLNPIILIVRGSQLQDYVRDRMRLKMWSSYSEDHDATVRNSKRSKRMMTEQITLESPGKGGSTIRKNSVGT